MVTGLGASSLTSVSINAEDKNFEESDEKGINKNGNKIYYNLFLYNFTLSLLIYLLIMLNKLCIV